ncbi:MAG: sigma-70 family RNA polymerase sigma factor [Bacteroidales bacterium]|jgi:RNA polymerase sigma factor (sigma-70 family)|nr:sigma-70 family RNA polymerase sigma factor [Bacteroidales bacterium]
MTTTTNTDIELWEHFRQGDESAFALIYQSYVQILFNYGSKLSSDVHFVMDCIHDLFVDLSNSRNTIGDTANIRFYLIKSLKNKMLRQLKIKQKTIHSDDYFSADAAWDTGYEEDESLKEQKKLLRNALNQLPARQKECVYLRYIIELSNEEISVVMNINYQAVRNTLSKALGNLRKELGKTTKEVIAFLALFTPNGKKEHNLSPSNHNYL